MTAERLQIWGSLNFLIGPARCCEGGQSTFELCWHCAGWSADVALCPLPMRGCLVPVSLRNQSINHWSVPHTRHPLISAWDSYKVKQSKDTYKFSMISDSYLNALFQSQTDYSDSYHVLKSLSSHTSLDLDFWSPSLEVCYMPSWNMASMSLHLPWCTYITLVTHCTRRTRQYKHRYRKYL